MKHLIKTMAFTLLGLVLSVNLMAAVTAVSASGIESGKSYVIVATYSNNDYLLKPATFSAKNSTAASFDASKVSASDAWLFTKSGDKWTIKLSTGEGLYFTNDNNGVACAKDKGASFSIVATTTGATTSYLTASDGTNTRYLALYQGSNWRCYKNTDNGVPTIQLYSISSTPTPSADPVETLYLSEAGSLSDNLKGTYKVGDKYTLPEKTDATCGDKVLVGWSTVEISTEGAKPTSNFHEPGAEVTLAANNNFYAVFADVTGGGETWIEITSEPTAGTYAILTDSYFMKASISSSRFQNGDATPKIENSKLTTAPAEDCIWEISKPDTYYRIKNGTKYAGGTSSKNQGALLDDPSADLAKWTISYDNVFTIINYGRSQASSDNNNKYLRNNTTNGWATYTSSTGSAPRLFKKSGGKSYSNYTTTCAPTYEATVASGIANGSVVISKTDDATVGAASLTGLKQGDKVYIFPTANVGYNIESVTVNETPISAQSGKYSYTIGTEGITISATFAPATYQISYDLADGAWVDENQVAKTYTYGIGATLPTADDVTKANNTFLGWFLNNAGEVATTVIGTAETGDKSFTARWLASGSKNVTINGDDKLTYKTFKPTTVDKDAESLEVEYSIEKGFTLVTVTVRVGEKELTGEEVEFSDTKLTITPNDGFTDDVAIQFMAAEKMFTVTWMANKAQFKQEQIQEGSKVTLPTETPSDVLVSAEETYKFQGWITEEQYSSETTAPAYITNNTIEPTGDVTYYAVYAILTPGSISNNYAKITAKTDLVEDGQYIIASGSKALNCDVYQNYYLTATGVTISNNKITNTNTKLVWTIEDVNGGDILLKSNDNGNYLQIINAGSGHYNLIAKNNDDDNANKSYFTPSVNNGNWTLKSRTNSSYYVSYYSNYNEFTTNTTASDLQLYKRQNNPDKYSNYRTRVAIIDHIAVNGTPAETKFVAGETFDATGLSIDVYYQGEDNPTNVTTGFTYAPTGELKTTDENITFTYQGKTADVTISVSNTVSGIAVTTNPSKMEYTEGEQFNPAGMEVTATYDNTAERVVTDYDYNPKGDLALGDKITVSFGGQTTELNITINEATKTTVNWFVEGVKLTEGEQSTAVIPGKKVTVLPTEPEACQGNQFVGWTTDADYYNATTAPTDLFKTAAAAPTIGETETNFYAVFAQLTATPIAESTVYTSNINNEILDEKIKIGGNDDNQVVAKHIGTSKTPTGSLSFNVPAGTKTITLHAVAWKEKSDVTITLSTKKAGVTITPSDAQAVNANDGAANSSPYSITPSDGDFYTFTLSGVTVETEVTITNATERVVLWGINVATEVLTDYSTTCLAALTAPTITTAEGTYCGSVDVEITQPAGNPEGAKIMYSTDNTNWSEYTAAVNITTSGTVYAKVVKEPKQTEVVSATYTIYPAYTLAQAATAATDASQMACLTFTDLLVQARSQSEAFLKASDGQIVLLSKTSHGLSVGDKLSASDAHVTFIKAHGLLQLTSMEDVEKGSTGTPVADVKAITEITAADYGKLVKIMNVTYNATDKKFTDEGGNEIVANAKFFVGGNLPSWPDGGKFNVTGIVLTDGENVVIAPRNSDDLESLATPLDAPTNFVVTSVNSYQASYSWTAVENNNGYTLYIYDGETEIYKSSTIGKTRTDYAPTTALEAGHAYTAKLVALGDKAEHSDSPAAEVEFTTNPNAQLNWYVGGTLYQTTYASQEKVVTPADPTSPCPTNYENFVTWYTEEIVSETGQITALEASKKVKAGDAAASEVTEKEYNFYAVFGKVKTPGTDKYVAVTSEPTKWEGEYLIVHNDSVFNGSLTTLDAEKNGVVLSKEEDGSYLASNANAYRFIIAKSTTKKDALDNDAVYYTIQSAQGYYIGGKDNSNGMNSNKTFATKTYDNTISWSTENSKVEIYSYYGNTLLTFNTTSDQLRFRYMKNEYGKIVLYKRTTTNPQYSGYITTCPVTYTITIAENAKGLVEAATTTEILKGAKVLLTATANAGYTKTGGNWIVKNTATKEVVDGLVGTTNYLTMPDYDVTVDYNFQEIKDQFVDNLHGNSAIEKGGANYELPVLSDFSETTGKPSDNFTKFIGWSATSYDSGEPATTLPTILEGNQTATGATYFAVWYNGSGKYITEYCQTPTPTNLHLVAEYHKATSVRIDWDNVTGADKYHIIVMDGEANIIADADVTASVYDLSGLTPGATYDCTVKAHKDCWSDESEAFEFTTKENIQSYAVTINAEGGIYEIDPELVDGKIQEGATVTITNIAPTDPAHYFFKELTVPEATDLIENEGTYMFTMPGKAVTINIVFAAYPTITWKMAGAADQTSTAVRNGDKFKVGTIKDAPADWKYKTYFPEFAGWVTSDKCDAEGNVTTAEFISATTEVPAAGLTVYGAVAKSATPDCSTATKITSNENLDMSALYVMGIEHDSKTKYFYNLSDGKSPWAQVSDDYTTNTPYMFTISGTKDALAILCKDGYVKGQTSNFAFSEEETTIVLTDEGLMEYSSTTDTYELAYNHNSGSGGIRWYKTTSISSYPLAYLYQVPLAYEKLTINPQPDYARTDLVVGNYGTVCVPYTVTAADRSGATFWNIETSDAIGSTNPTSVTIVEETGVLVAGKPYIFCATDTKMTLFFSGDKYEGTESVAANGLFGNLTDEDIIINATGYVPGYFFVLQQKLYECGTNCTVSPNRGWVQANQIEDKTTPSSAPRRVIGNPNGTPTGIHNLNADGFKNIEGARKYFHNNHIMIVNEGRIYNAQGIRIQ